MMGHNDRVVALFVLLIAVTFILKAVGAFSAELTDVIWPTFLGIIALLWMGKK
jgi:hypothetical protein